MSLDENLPIANWPEQDGHYKVVQLEIHGKPYLQFAPTGNTHGGILMKLLGIFKKEDLPFVGRSGARLPALEGQGYKAVGMGVSTINRAEKRASFFGDSFDYRIKINPKHLDAIRVLVPDWKIEYLTC